MSTNRIAVENILADRDYENIDTFCKPGLSIEELSVFLQSEFDLELTTDTDIVEGFVKDSSNLPGESTAVCRPSNERECAIIFRCCYAAHIPYTVSAGKSNLTGSATPEGGVIVSTVNLLGPDPEVDEKKRCVTSPVGIILEDLRERVLNATDNRLMFPVDPTSRADATVGGVLACNASGFTPGETGAVREWVSDIRVLLPSGLRIDASRGEYVSEGGEFLLEQSDAVATLPVPRYPRVPIKNAAGPFSSADGVVDFIDLIVGSEGLFGLITSCTLRLSDRPADYLDLVFSLPSETEALKLHKFLRVKLESFEQLSAFEYFGVNSRKYMDHEKELFSGEDQVAINIQVPLFEKSIDDETKQ